MIAERYKWMLRSPEACFDEIPNADGFPCRICRVKEKGEIGIPALERDRHWANHRREKIQPREVTT